LSVGKVLKVFIKLALPVILAGYVFAQGGELTQSEREELEEFKKLSNFENWPGKDGKLKTGFRLKKELLGDRWHHLEFSEDPPWLNPQKGAVGLRYDLGKGDKHIGIRIVVGSGSIEAIQERILLRRLSWASPASPQELKPKAKGPGDAYIGGPPYSYVLFARNNLAVQVTGGEDIGAEGVMELAERIDSLIVKQPVAEPAHFLILELKTPNEIHLAKGEKARIVIKRGNKDVPLTVRAIPPFSKAVNVRTGVIKEAGETVSIPVEAKGSGTVEVHIGAYSNDTLLSTTRSVTVVVDGKDEPRSGAITNKNEHQAGTQEDDAREGEATPDGDLVSQSESGLKQGAPILVLGFIIAIVVLAGVVLFLLLRGKRS
jgi:hypothetical protein